MSADRQTPETDAHQDDLLHADTYTSWQETLKHARNLERERDEAREIAKKYEDRYFTMSELRNNASIVALQYKAQRDRLLEALKVVLEDWKAGYRPEESGKSFDMARAAIAEVEGRR